MKLTSLTIALDEEDCIGAALASVKDHVDEMVVVDGGSRDRTVELAQDMGAKVTIQPFEYDFGRQKNYAIAQAADADWVLIIDSDEVFEPALSKRLTQFIHLAENHPTEDIDCWEITRKNFYTDEPDTPVEQLFNWPDYQKRLFKPYCRFKGYIHEQLHGYSMLKRIPPKYGSIVHTKSRERQHKQDDLYYLLRPTDYPERLGRDLAMQQRLQAVDNKWGPPEAIELIKQYLKV